MTKKADDYVCNASCKGIDIILTIVCDYDLYAEVYRFSV